MKYSNVLSFLTGEGRLWAGTDDFGQRLLGVVNGIAADDVARMRQEYMEVNKTLAQDGSEPLNVGAGRGANVTIENGIATVPIFGTIMQRANLFMAFSGGTSTDKLTQAIKTLHAREDVKSVILHVNSDGGSVHGLAHAAQAIRDLREDKPVYAIADSAMNSAAYWLGSAADKVFVTPSAIVGSIGVLQVLQQLPEEEQARFHIFRSVPRKAKPNAAEPLTAEDVEEIESMLSKIHADFVAEVALNRQITQKQAKKMADGTVKVGSDAVEAGLADGVASIDEIRAELKAAQDDKNALTLATAHVEALASELEVQASARRDAENRVAELEAEIARRDAEAFEAKVNSLVEGAVASGKIVPARAEKMLADLLAGKLDVATVEALFEATPAHAAVPEGTPLKEREVAPVEAADPDDLTPRTEIEKRMFASTSLGRNWKQAKN